jgi:hypothetical protein
MNLLVLVADIESVMRLVPDVGFVVRLVEDDEFVVYWLLILNLSCTGC